MKCGEVRAFMSQIAGKSASAPFQPVDLNYLTTNGYVSVMPLDQYDQAAAEVASLIRLNEELYQEETEVRAAADELRKDEQKTHSILFHFRGVDEKQAELAEVERERGVVQKEQADVVQKESQITQTIQKKSMVDRMVRYDGGYASLTGLGVLTLGDLNVRNYRVSDMDFADFLGESRETSVELRSIAEKGSYHVSNLVSGMSQYDLSHLWSIAIGLGKLEGDPNQIGERYLSSLNALQNIDSTPENKMAAAEIMTSVGAGSVSSSDNSDLQSASKALSSLDHDLRHHDHVPKELAASIAATMFYGRRYDGTFPTDKFAEYCKITYSKESAAILSIVNVAQDQLTNKFYGFRGMFNAWGYQLSEDTELASAYLAVSDLQATDVHAKMAIIVDALKNYLAYPLVGAAILTSIATFEANETLDLMEKAFSLLASYAGGLQRSELVSLSVRMIHGIRNELVRQLDPTAKIMNTPIQFIHSPSPIFFPYRGPLIIAHHSYFSTYSSLGGYHPAHVHGFGGGYGG